MSTVVPDADPDASIPFEVQVQTELASILDLCVREPKHDPLTVSIEGLKHQCTGAQLMTGVPPWMRAAVHVYAGYLIAEGGDSLQYFWSTLTTAVKARKDSGFFPDEKFDKSVFNQAIRLRVEERKHEKRQAAEAARRTQLAANASASRNPDGTDNSNLDITSDYDASLRFVLAYRDDIRYSPGVGWLAWDGKRWKEGKSLVSFRAQRAARDRTLDAITQRASAQTLTRCYSLENHGRIEGMLELASANPAMQIDADKLDADPYLLNCLNGVLNLKVGKLILHEDTKELYLTKLAPVDYVPTAVHPLFTQYCSTLDKIHPGLSAFLSRCGGMTLTGDSSAEVLHLLQGPGGGGKTTITEALGAIMGDYAMKVPINVFLETKQSKSGEGASPFLVKMRGARMVYCAESNENARLDSGTVKQLTGNERVSARGLWKDPITFSCTWKIWIASNWDPKTAADDSGMWRRLVKVFIPEIPESDRDPAIKEAMGAEKNRPGDVGCQQAILAWLVRGCMQWVDNGRGRNGLQIPTFILETTNEYRESQDAVMPWAKACGVSFKVGIGWEQAGPLRNSYIAWCSQNSVRPLDPARWTKWLESKRCTRKACRVEGKGPYDGWVGVVVKKAKGALDGLPGTEEGSAAGGDDDDPMA